MSEREALKSELLYWQRVIGDRMGADDRRFGDMVRDLRDVLAHAPGPGEPPLSCPAIDAFIATRSPSDDVVKELEAIRHINSQLRYGLWAEKQRAEEAERYPPDYSERADDDRRFELDMPFVGSQSTAICAVSPPSPDTVREALVPSIRNHFDSALHWRVGEDGKGLDNGLTFIETRDLLTERLLRGIEQYVAALSRPAPGGWEDKPIYEGCAEKMFRDFTYRADGHFREDVIAACVRTIKHAIRWRDAAPITRNDRLPPQPITSNKGE